MTVTLTRQKEKKRFISRCEDNLFHKMSADSLVASPPEEQEVLEKQGLLKIRGGQWKKWKKKIVIVNKEKGLLAIFKKSVKLPGGKLEPKLAQKLIKLGNNCSCKRLLKQETSRDYCFSFVQINTNSNANNLYYQFRASSTVEMNTWIRVLASHGCVEYKLEVEQLYRARSLSAVPSSPMAKSQSQPDVSTILGNVVHQYGEHTIVYTKKCELCASLIFTGTSCFKCEHCSVVVHDKCLAEAKNAKWKCLGLSVEKQLTLRGMKTKSGEEAERMAMRPRTKEEQEELQRRKAARPQRSKDARRTESNPQKPSKAESSSSDSESDSESEHKDRDKDKNKDTDENKEKDKEKEEEKKTVPETESHEQNNHTPTEIKLEPQAVVYHDIEVSSVVEVAEITEFFSEETNHQAMQQIQQIDVQSHVQPITETVQELHPPNEDHEQGHENKDTAQVIPINGESEITGEQIAERKESEARESEKTNGSSSVEEGNLGDSVKLETIQIGNQEIGEPQGSPNEL